MLPRVHRIVSGLELREVQRRGKKTATPFFVVATAPAPNEVSRWGFVVSKKVGNAVTRNLVKRRLRELAGSTRDRHPDGMRTVVRALPASSKASFAELAAAWEEALGRVQR